MTGEQGLSAATMQRLTDNYSPLAIASLLQAESAGESPVRRLGRGREETRGVRSEVDPVKVAKFARTLTTSLADLKLPATTVIGLAGMIARQNVGATQFARNLAQVREWVRQTNQDIPVPSEGTARAGAYRAPGFNWQDQVWIAVQGTQAKRKFQSNIDVVKFVAGPNVQSAIESGERAEATARADTTRAVRRDDQGNITAEEEAGIKAQGAAASYDALPQAMLMANSPAGKDFFKEAQEIEKRIRLEKTAFQRSWLGKALEPVMRFANAGLKATEGVVIDAAAIGILGVGDIRAVLGDETIADAKLRAAAYRTQAHRRLDNGEFVGAQIAHDAGAPEAVGVGLDFVLGWYLDPFVIGGGVLKGLRAVRVAPGVLESSVKLTTVIRKNAHAVFGEKALNRWLDAEMVRRDIKWADFYDSAGAFSKSKSSHSLLRTAFGEEASTKAFFRKLDELRLNYSASHPMSYAYMKALRDKLRERFPGRAWNDPEVTKAWEEGVLGAFGVRPSAGSVADDAGKLLAGEQTTLREKLAKDLEDLAPGAGAEAREGMEAIVNDPFLLPMGLEVPQYRFLGGLPGPRRLVRRGLTSDIVQSTSLGRRVGRLNVMNPGRYLNYHVDPDQTAYELARYFRLDESTSRAWQSKILEAKTGGAGFENRIDDLMDDLAIEGIRNVAKPYNISPEVLDEFIAAHLDPIRAQNSKMQAFGVEEVSTPLGEATLAIERPLFESQLRNFSFLVDPIEIETRLQQVVGAPKRAEQLFFRSLKKLHLGDVPQLAPKLSRLESRTVRFQDTTREWARAYLRLWKAGTVARPAYVTRVVLLDEQLRFLATTGSITERMLAQRSFAGLAEKTGIFDRELRIGDETIRLNLPGHHGYEPLAANQTRQAETLAEMARAAGQDYDSLVKGGGWDVVYAEKNPKLHLASWRRALVRDIANSPHGNLALEAVAAGSGLDETIDILKAYAREQPNFVRLQRSGMLSGVDDIDRWAQQVAQVTHSYTLAGSKVQRSLAETVLKQPDDLDRVLAAVNKADRPPVHGPMTADVMLGNGATSLQQRVIDGAYKAFVQKPEDLWNRQPYYRVWKTRAENAYLGHLEQVYKKNPELLREIREGTEAKLWPSASRGEFIDTSDQLAAIFRAKEDDYWYHQTKADPATLSEGLTPRIRLEADGTPRPWEGGGREPRVYAAPAPEFSTYLTDQRAGPMLRFKRADTDFKPGMFAIDGTDIPAEFISTKAVPASKIEFFGRDEAWHPLSEAAKTVRVPHPFRKAVDVASRQFALEQVKKIMFDFTRQSRFSELLRLAAPFPQPFFEGFQAWGHIAVRNPAIIGRARTLFELGKDMEWWKQDPETGEWSVKMGMYANVARNLWLWDKGVGDSLSFTAPLSSFNMLAQSSIQLPADGILGKMVGGTYVPVPGLHPPLMRWFQMVLADNPSEAVTGYLFQYGPVTPLIPKSIRIVLDNVRRAFGDTPEIDENRLTSYTGEIMKQFQAQGLAVDKDGNPLPEAEVVEMARQQAIDLIMSQELVSLFSPGALRARFGHDEVEDEFNRRASEDPTAAYKWLEENHPDLSLIGLGKTFFTGAYKDANGEPVRAPRAISTEVFGQLMTQPGFKGFARNHPEWLALMLVGLGETAREFDFSTFSRQARSGVLSYKRDADYWAAGEDGKAWNKWYEWRRDQWVPQFEALPDEVEEDDPAYTALKQRRSMELTHIALEHPGWARRHLKQASDGTWDFAYDPSGGPASVIEVLADARAIANTKGWENHPGVQSLSAYLEGRDALEERMQAAGVRSVYDSEDFSAEYEKLKKRAVGIVPEADQSTMQTFFDSYFENDLTNIRGYQDRQLEALRKRNPELAEGVVKYDTKLEVLSSKAQTGFEANWERSQRYQDVRTYQERIYKTDPKVVRKWWGLMKPGEQEEYKENLVTRPSVFWSSFDWEVMGTKLSKNAQAALNQIADYRISIQKKENADPTYSEGDGYEEIDTAIRGYRGKDKSFDEAVKHMSDWAYPLAAAGLAERPITGHVWELVIKGIRDVQAMADRNQWKGVDYGKDDARKAYAGVQDQVTEWVMQWQKKVPAFKEEWDTIKKALGGSVIEDLLIPDNYFGRLGSVD